MFFICATIKKLIIKNKKNKNMAKKRCRFHIFSKCKRYNVPLWQCPEFLFVIMGLVIIIASLIFYAIGGQYVADLRIVALMVTAVAALLLTIAFIITHSFEKLAEADRMKAEFVGIVSHQMRSPLTNVRWAIQFFNPQKFNELEDSQKEECFDIIRENSARMESLLNDLLTVAKLQEGKITNKKKTFSMESLIEKILEEHNSLVENKNLQTSIEVSPGLADIFASYPLAKIVLENLINNAVSYSKEGGKIEIKAEKKGNKAMIIVKDEGVGIPQDDKKHIFQRFFRAKNAATEETKGTGLGLFITKMVLDELKGRIWFKSQLGKGSTFYCTLPIK